MTLFEDDGHEVTSTGSHDPDAGTDALQRPAGSRRILAAARRARRPARLAAAIAVVSGILNLLSATLPADRYRLHQLQHYVPGETSSTAAIVVAALGVAMLLLANGLHRRSRMAWALSVTLLIASAVGHVLKGLDLEEALFETFMAGYLVGTSEHFTARPERIKTFAGRIFEAAGVLSSAFLFGVIGIVSSTDVGITNAAGSAFDLMVARDPGVVLPDRVADVLPTAVLALLIVGLLIVFYRTLAPVTALHGPPATPAEALASNDSLAWFATRDDKIAVRSGAAAVSYGQFGTVALASGDPLGPEDAWPDAIDEFFREVARQGRYGAVIACSRAGAAAYGQGGLRQLYMGDEAVLDTSKFTLQGGVMKTVRNSHTRAVKAGYTARVMRVSDLDKGLADQLRSISAAWRAGSEERGFSMALGRLFEEEDADAFVVVGFDADDQPRGFIHFVPWMRDGVSLDVMRRDRQAIAVLNDFLVAEAARQFPEYGVARISLNFSALRGVLVAGSEAGAPWTLRLQRWALLRLSSSFQIETLYRFNRKFDPQWVPRYLMLGALEDAPFVLWAALRAEGLLPSIALRGEKDEQHVSAPVAT